AGSARCLQCRAEAAGAAVDREEREEARSAAAPPAADPLDRSLARHQARWRAVCESLRMTAERIDREQLCERVQQCVLRCELIVEGEMKFYGIEVEITDINDNAPSFKEIELEETISEMTAPGSQFPLAEAQDPDSGRNSLQSYELSGDEHFSLAVQTGPGGDQRPELVLAKALDREEAAFHELVLRASDGGDPARTGTARIRVTVLDANDNAPVFSQAEYTVRVPEDVPVGSVLVTVRATDADEGLNGHLKYSFKKITEKALKIFYLDSETGEIRLLRSLDFEEGDSYELEVQARDGGGLSDTAEVSITVKDINDNAPEISVRSALSEISEDALSGTVVALLHVHDRDSGVNGEVRCSIDKDVPFRLQSSQGNYYSVVTARELDREQVAEYNVTVRAADGGSPALQSSAVLALRVLDVNDNAPVFAEERYSARLAENNAAGALVLTVRATDADWGQNARVAQCVLRCELIVQGEMKIYRIEVEITDINDNAPSFKEAELEERISEGTAPGSRFPLPEAHDLDSGQNSLQSYELSGDEHFSLAVQAGPGGDQRPELVLAKALDREEAAFHELVLRASDGGDPARTGTARIRVTVLDANDNAPVFSQAEYTVRVPEDVPVGSVLVTVRATDADEGLNGHLKYSFKKITEKALKIFYLDSETGEIRLLRSLDFEEGDSYELEVQARDGGGLSDTAEVSITVKDINDNAPEISVRSALSEISEDALSGTVVALLHVHDRDSGVNGEVRCSIDKDVPFRLQSSQGNYYSVVTARELDREQVAEYNVTVRAADGGSPALQSSAVLALRVLDVNDNAPVFAEERYSARLAENNAAGALVLTVRATDADWGQNARVRYRLAEGRVRGAPLSSYVSVQAETGALYALRSFDYEQLRELQLWVRAEDGGAPALSSNVSVRLLIVDENDNAPQVLYPPPGAAAGSGAAWSGVELAPRRSEAGALVAKVVAVDADAGQNAWLSYELAKATEPGLFRVGLHSGEVRTARSPLARDAARQSLVVLVKDHGRPALSATATLSVVLAESVAELLAELGSAADEAAAPGEPAAGLTRWLVLAVAAVSCLFVAFLLLLLALRLRRWHRQQLLPADSGALRGVPVSHFVGIDGVRAFLQSYSHDVSLTADSRKSQLRFSAASCCDTLPARPPPDEPAPLLGDEDPAAALPASSAPPSVRKAENEGSVLYICMMGPADSCCTEVDRAQDADVGTNALLTYHLTSDPSFSLALKETLDGSKQPELVLERALDREKQSCFELVLTAVDGGDPARSGTVQVRINVTDLNDNPPVFSKGVYEARVAENLPAGSLVLRVRATDADAGTNGRVSYSLSNVHGTISALFTVDSDSGEVRTAGPLDFEEK
ncbi:LOW QUALITY PROTEIN: protocadherin gamma-A10-like, partial [Onychostruthus taczanowskii]|uniref:LOW QUALITY PROTEIN: protocadherin gamma-A10-like n=1 Tax=Onychostruthus taczanowskii TaxID=356909 RepID=UPI001B7FF3FD